jgi:CheY-like chemotaxis protein
MAELFASKALPDILFIDERHINKELLKRCLRLEMKIILIATSNSKIHTDIPKNKILKIINKPINFSKSLQALELLGTSKNSQRTILTKERETFENMDILVVEDNIINQKLIFNILKNLKAKVSLASNGKEALKISKENFYDIILMDIEMPIMGGIEATERIIAHEKEFNKKHTPIIALTANNTEKDKKQYLDNGMDGYLQKPLQITSLKNILNKYFKIKDVKVEEKKKHILLYKGTKVSGRIYEAVLNNLGYKVDITYSETEFKRQVSNKKYEFALFDAKQLLHRTTEESQKEMVKLIKNHGATPLSFTEEKNYKRYCRTINEGSSVNELEAFLKQA